MPSLPTAVVENINNMKAAVDSAIHDFNLTVAKEIETFKNTAKSSDDAIEKANDAFNDSLKTAINTLREAGGKAAKDATKKDDLKDIPKGPEKEALKEASMNIGKTIEKAQTDFKAAQADTLSDEEKIAEHIKRATEEAIDTIKKATNETEITAAKKVLSNKAEKIYNEASEGIKNKFDRNIIDGETKDAKLNSIAATGKVLLQKAKEDVDVAASARIDALSITTKGLKQKTFKFPPLASMYEKLDSTVNITTEERREFVNITYDIRKLKGDDLKEMVEQRAANAAMLASKTQQLSLGTETTFNKKEYDELLTSFTGAYGFQDTAGNKAYIKKAEPGAKNSAGKEYDAELVQKRGGVFSDAPVATISRIDDGTGKGQGNVSVTFVKQGNKEGKGKEKELPKISEIRMAVDTITMANATKGKNTITINNCVSDAQIKGSLLKMAMVIKEYGNIPMLNQETEAALNSAPKIKAAFEKIKDMEREDFVAKFTAANKEVGGDSEKALQKMITDIEKDAKSESKPFGMSG